MRKSDTGARRRWPLWYWIATALALPVLAVAGLFVGAVPLAKRFYIRSEAMEPTLLKNDHILAWMQPPNPLRRGDVILFRMEEGTWIKRIAAVPGDRIAVRGGIVILNGRPVPQAPVPSNTVVVYEAGAQPPRTEVPLTRRILKEQFPGEAQPHRILDSGSSFEDDFAEVRVLPGHVFVLGDNRDNSADSRIPHAEEGVDQLPVADIRGTAWRYLWGPSHQFRQPIR